MTDTELATRVAEIRREYGRGFYVDALELERDLFRDLAEECRSFYYEVQGSEVLGHCRRAIAATRELSPQRATT